MYQVYTTPGIVLAKYEHGEDTAVAMILTRELGLVRASVRAARRESSKLRFGIEPFTYADFSFIRGARGWKLTATRNIERLLCTNISLRAVEGRVARLALRLVSVDEPMPDFYDAFLTGVHGLTSGLDPSVVEVAECIAVLQMLSRLGYVSQTAFLEPYMAASAWAPSFLSGALPDRRSLVATINNSLRATGL